MSTVKKKADPRFFSPLFPHPPPPTAQNKEHAPFFSLSPPLVCSPFMEKRKSCEDERDSMEVDGDEGGGKEKEGRVPSPPPHKKRVTTSPSPNMNGLADEVLVRIMLFVGPLDTAVSLSRVCALFRRVSCDGVLWREFTKEYPILRGSRSRIVMENELFFGHPRIRVTPAVDADDTAQFPYRQGEWHPMACPAHPPIVHAPEGPGASRCARFHGVPGHRYPPRAMANAYTPLVDVAEDSRSCESCAAMAAMHRTRLVMAFPKRHMTSQWNESVMYDLASAARSACARGADGLGYVLAMALARISTSSVDHIPIEQAISEASGTEQADSRPMTYARPRYDRATTGDRSSPEPGKEEARILRGDTRHVRGLLGACRAAVAHPSSTRLVTDIEALITAESTASIRRNRKQIPITGRVETESRLLASAMMMGAFMGSSDSEEEEEEGDAMWCQTEPERGWGKTKAGGRGTRTGKRATDMRWEPAPSLVPVIVDITPVTRGPSLDSAIAHLRFEAHICGCSITESVFSSPPPPGTGVDLGTLLRYRSDRFFMDYAIYEGRLSDLLYPPSISSSASGVIHGISGWHNQRTESDHLTALFLVHKMGALGDSDSASRATRALVWTPLSDKDTYNRRLVAFWESVVVTALLHRNVEVLDAVVGLLPKMEHVNSCRTSRSSSSVEIDDGFEHLSDDDDAESEGTMHNGRETVTTRLRVPTHLVRFMCMALIGSSSEGYTKSAPFPRLSHRGLHIRVLPTRCHSVRPQRTIHLRVRDARVWREPGHEAHHRDLRVGHSVLPDQGPGGLVHWRRVEPQGRPQEAGGDAGRSPRMDRAVLPVPVRDGDHLRRHRQSAPGRRKRPHPRPAVEGVLVRCEHAQGREGRAHVRGRRRGGRRR